MVHQISLTESSTVFRPGVENGLERLQATAQTSKDVSSTKLSCFQCPVVRPGLLADDPSLSRLIVVNVSHVNVIERLFWSMKLVVVLSLVSEEGVCCLGEVMKVLASMCLVSSPRKPLELFPPHADKQTRE